MAKDRTRNWTFTAYPESMPDDWEQRLADLKIPLCYIVHDRDTEEDGTLKKAHVHIVAKYDGLKSLSQVQEDFEFTGIKYIQPVRNFATMCRYLCHLDNPEKAQYSTDSVVSCGGCGVEFSRKFTKSEELAMIADMSQFIEDNDIHEFADIWKYSVRNNPDWLAILSSRASYGVSQYIRSRRCAMIQKVGSEHEFFAD